MFTWILVYQYYIACIVDLLGSSGMLSVSGPPNSTSPIHFQLYTVYTALPCLLQIDEPI